MTDLSRARRTPYAHQVTGVDRILATKAMLLADDMRLGKSKQIIDSACVLFERDELDYVIVVAPAPVRDVWFDTELGEIRKHMWEDLPYQVVEHHRRTRVWTDPESLPSGPGTRILYWIVTNYEFIRSGLKRKSGGWSGPRLQPLLQFASPRTMLVLDESSEVAHHDTLQTRACAALRQKCGRIVELNGTPIVETPEALFSQANLLDPRILDCKYVTQFRARYAIMGGFMVTTRFGQKVPTQILGWRHKPGKACAEMHCEVPQHIPSPVHSPGLGIEDLQERLAPYVLRRIKKDCLDLPPKLEPVTLTATLTPETWRLYRELQEDFVAWLDKGTAAVAAQAGVRAMRLAQLTSGFLGGLRDNEAACPECRGAGFNPAYTTGEQLTFQVILDDDPDATDCRACRGTGLLSLPIPPREVGREKLDVLLHWVGQRLSEEPDMRMLVWTRFRPELDRIVRSLPSVGVLVREIRGGQKKDERRAGLRLMHPDTQYSGPAILVGTQQTGSVGLNLAGAHEVVYASNDYSLFIRRQSEDRPHGPGQRCPVSYHDIVAVGPEGQHTIDHIILAALRAKQDISTWVTSAWVSALRRL